MKEFEETVCRIKIHLDLKLQGDHEAFSEKGRGVIGPLECLFRAQNII